MKHIVLSMAVLLAFPASVLAAEGDVYVQQEPLQETRVKPGDDVILNTFTFRFVTSAGFGDSAFGKANVRALYLRVHSADTPNLSGKLSQVLLRNVVTGYSMDAKQVASGEGFVVYEFKNFVVGREDTFILRADIGKGATSLLVDTEICATSQGNCATLWGMKRVGEFITSAEGMASGELVGVCMAGAKSCPAKMVVRNVRAPSESTLRVRTLRRPATPASRVQTGDKGINVLSLELTADCKGPARVQSVTVVHGGPGATSDVAQVFLMSENGFVLGSSRTVNPNDRTVMLNFEPPLTVVACSKKIVNIDVAFKPEAAQRVMHTFMVELPSDIQSDAIAMEGQFPLSSSNIQLIAPPSPVAGGSFVPANKQAALRTWYNAELRQVNEVCQAQGGTADAVKICVAKGRDRIRQDMRTKARKL